MLIKPNIHFKKEIESIFGLCGIFHALNRNNQISMFILSREGPKRKKYQILNVSYNIAGKIRSQDSVFYKAMRVLLEADILLEVIFKRVGKLFPAYWEPSNYIYAAVIYGRVGNHYVLQLYRGKYPELL